MTLEAQLQLMQFVIDTANHTIKCQDAVIIQLLAERAAAQANNNRRKARSLETWKRKNG